MEFLGLGECQLNFEPAPAEVHPGRDQGQTTLRNLADELAKLPPMDEELAGPERVVILIGGVRIWAEVALHEI